MPIPLSKRNPEITARLDESIERARELAVLSPDDVNKIGGAGLEAVAAKEAAEFRKKGPNQYLFEEITDTVTRLEFRKAMRHAESFFAQSKIETPTDEDFVKSDVDIKRLSHFYNDLFDNGIFPSVVLAPHGLGFRTWEELYGKPPNGQPLILRGLIADSKLINNWDKFDTIYADDDSRPIIKDKNGREWSLSVIDASPQPTKNGVNYYGNTSEMERRSRPAVSNDRHPTISEYLTLQALNIRAGSLTIDGSSFSSYHQTWICADSDDVLIDDQPSAPRGVYFGPSGKVMLSLSPKRDSFDAGIREVYR